MHTRTNRAARVGAWIGAGLFVALFPAGVSLAADGPPSADSPLCVSDAMDQLGVTCTQGWGKLGINTAVVPPDGRAPTPLRIGDKTFEKGLGHHAPGEIVVPLDGRYTTFEAQVGVQSQGGSRGSVVFTVLVDGEQRFDSGRMTDSDPPRPISLPVVGAKELKLVTGDGGDGITCDVANWVEATLTQDPSLPVFGAPRLVLNGAADAPVSAAVCGLAFAGAEAGPQALLLPGGGLYIALPAGQGVRVDVPIEHLPGPVEASAELRVEGTARVSLAWADGAGATADGQSGACRIAVPSAAAAPQEPLSLAITAGATEATVRVFSAAVTSQGKAYPVPVAPAAGSAESSPPAVSPPYAPAIERMLIEWDWRMQDGIATPRAARTYAQAIESTLGRGDALLAHLRAQGVAIDTAAAQWEALRAQYGALAAAAPADADPAWESLWRQVHQARRDLVFTNPLAQTGPVLFLKHVPSSFSHQLTQYYGRYARPGGGVFVLPEPGKSMACLPLASNTQAPGVLPGGSCMLPDVAYDGQRVLFSFCEAPTSPASYRYGYHGRYYHIYEMNADGSGLRQLTFGPFDDFAPRYLPSGKILFLSTRRGGFHRCGSPGCEVYTLAMMEADGSDPRTISYHETQEWDPAVLNDGRIIYTRWDYVDRNAVHYQQLWSIRPDGSAPAAYYGNNTFSPVGVWEARAVPGSRCVMATAAAHHAMTAGSIILLDTAKGVDGLDPITRLTPDAPFPESETTVPPANWHAPGPHADPPPTPAEAERWPGHCYRSPCPLSEDVFLAAYSYIGLLGEPVANAPNMFGLYLVDRFGNKELLYRDLNIASQWPVPLRARPKPPAEPEVRTDPQERQGTFYLQDVYAAAPSLPPGSVKGLRIIQVLPKSSSGANNPTVGLANASPGKQVLGTVPVEEDGSAYFTAPAGIPLAFQALDEQGRALQIMRSITYLQRGEHASCVGCHENRLTAPPTGRTARAMARPPSRIEPGPDGSRPLSYPLLVQPVLDAHCLRCHSGEKPAGPEGKPIVLTGAPEGRYTASYNVLAAMTPFPQWGGGDMCTVNSEPLTQPEHFGAVASPVLAMLLKGHHEVALNKEEMARLITWMDANALFYGTFDASDQARQQRGERIAGPALE